MCVVLLLFRGTLYYCTTSKHKCKLICATDCAGEYVVKVNAFGRNSDVKVAWEGVRKLSELEVETWFEQTRRVSGHGVSRAGDTFFFRGGGGFFTSLLPFSSANRLYSI